jgi:hypothetical protein
MQVPVRLRPALVGLLGIVPALMGPAFASERVRGEVVLSAPQCAVFVVRTGQGNSVLEASQYYGVLEGDEVRGLLHERGSQEIELVGEASLPVKIEDWGLPNRQAARLFYRRCNIAADARDEALSLAGR